MTGFISVAHLQDIIGLVSALDANQELEAREEELMSALFNSKVSFSLLHFSVCELALLRQNLTVSAWSSFVGGAGPPITY